VIRPRLLLVDNVDSFSFMLADYLTVAGADLDIVRNDAVSVDEALERGRDGIVISPGPGKPQDAGISVALAEAAVAEHRPFLGVCLGHQALALACGGTVDRVPPVHGKIAAVDHDGTGLFEGLPSPLDFTRYHSLAVTAVPEALEAQAWTENGTVMAMRHRSAPAHGVQFHPESVASTSGHALMSAFVRLCGGA
jgi:anthranilate synthase/aminodeoxychorismate synthase-like glutamine amidotransferase